MKRSLILSGLICLNLLAGCKAVDPHAPQDANAFARRDQNQDLAHNDHALDRSAGGTIGPEGIRIGSDQ